MINKIVIIFFNIYFTKHDFILTLKSLMFFSSTKYMSCSVTVLRTLHSNKKMYLYKAARQALSQSHWEPEGIEEKCPSGLCERGEAVTAA